MRDRRRSRALLILLLAAAIACGSAQKTAYQTFGIITYAADTAMTIYADAVVDGTVSEPLQAEVRSLYEKYQGAAAAAETGIRIWNATGTGDFDFSKLWEAAGALGYAIEKFTSRPVPKELRDHAPPIEEQGRINRLARTTP